MIIDQSLVNKVFDLAKSEGVTPTAVSTLNVYVSSNEIPLMPMVLQPAICFVLQGKKKVVAGRVHYEYSPNTYLINSVIRPVEASVLDVNKDQPYVGLSLGIDRHVVGQLMMEMNRWDHETKYVEQATLTQSTSLTVPISNALERLVNVLSEPMDCDILASSICRDLYYQVLKGPCGGLLRNSVSHHAGANRIAPVVHYIEQHFERNIDIEEIADVAGMSVSSLHEHFKLVTSVSPMQYVKSLRLHKARSMLSQGYQVSEVCFGVGYSSPSQFSREFKRYFGITPSNAKSSVATIG
ncbi:AraC family transcriptional regulator [Enterovibrio sp. ZSDZ35]|uniref:AraC family transcriptional regulator n=1 Tax=Enterovibrio qingdaonensis TaxID=2899818 RepID=A0ABT5QF28_9GAMM|nr:AraC family transcriptional regulator [Enterovibrio sp. ZSDZ35]MDD1779577.1 AraC family transcriptional regulator [Enterovibrio sp. ZSDZ35]